MKKIISIIIAAVFIFTFAACGGKNNAEVTVNKEYMRYDVGERQKSPIVGFGAQIDTDVFMPWNNLTEEDEKIWDERIGAMNLKYARVKYYPEMYERANDNDDPNVFDYDAEGVDFNCAEMQALYKILDICQKYDIKIDLGSYNCYNWFKSVDGKYEGSWMGVDTSNFVNENWTCGPADFYEYAENVSVLIKYLIEEKGYTCIWGFSHIQECYANKDGASPYAEYVECVKILDERFKKDGIRDKVKLIYSGSVPANGNIKMMRSELEELKGVVDVIGTASYPTENSLNENLCDYYEQLAGVRDEMGMNYISISEFCEGGHFLDAVNKTDIDAYEAGITISRLCVNAASRGVTAFDHYILGDTMFTNAYIHTMGLWYYKEWHDYYAGPLKMDKKNFIPYGAHPEYYFYSLFTRLTETGSYAYRVDTNELSYEEYEEGADVCAVAFRLPGGSWTYFAVNKGERDRKIAIVNVLDGHPNEMDVYKVTEDIIPADRKCEPLSASGTLEAKDGVAYLVVPARGMIAVSDRKVG